MHLIYHQIRLTTTELYPIFVEHYKTIVIMNKLLIYPLLSFCCCTLFFSNLFSYTTPPPPTVTVPDAFDTDGDGNVTEPLFNADGAPLIRYCAGTDFANIPVATAQGEPGAIFFWYRDIDPLDEPDFTVTPPTGVGQVIGSFGPSDQDFNAGAGFIQSDSIYVVQNVNDCISDYAFIELIITDLIINIPPTYVCRDEMGNVAPTTIAPVVLGGEGNYTYSWITPFGYSGPTNEAEITTSITGYYILTVTDVYMCSDTKATTVFISTPPEVEIMGDSNLSTCADNYTFDVTVHTTDNDNDDNGNYTFNWSIIPANSSIISSGPNATVFADTADVLLTVTVTDSNGCEGTDDLEVTVNLIGGTACDDGNAGTVNDVYNSSCECVGISIAQNFCTDITLNMSNNPIADGIYDAIQTVTSAGVVENGSTVSHIAGDVVVLNPGFTVEPNAYFVADIIPCPMLITQPETDDKEESQD